MVYLLLTTSYKDYMNVLQIANGYLEKGLYRQLFFHLEKYGVNNTIFVPVENVNNSRTYEDNVKIIKCYNEIDRKLFFPKQLKTIIKAKRAFDINQFDIIHAHTLFSTGYSARKLSTRFGIPYIVAVRNTDVNLFFEKMPFMRNFGENILRDASKIVYLSTPYRDLVLSKYLKEKHRDEIRDKSVVIPNGIDDYFFSETVYTANTIDKEIRLIHIGDVDRNKNIEATIRALEYLKSEIKDLPIVFTVVGEIKDVKYLELINSHKDIKYYPKCQKESVVKFLRQSHILVMPSHHETFGLVYAEAISQGIPIIYTKGQGFDGQFEDGFVGFAVDDKNPREIAECVKKIVFNYHELSANCIKSKKRFKWDIIARQYSEIYRKEIMNSR